MRQILAPLLLCAAAAWASEDASPLETAEQLMADTKHSLKRILAHNPRMASEWNDLMGLSLVDDELHALARELSDMEEEEEKWGFGGIGKMIGGAMDAVGDAVGDVVDKAKDIAGDVVDAAKDLKKDLFGKDKKKKDKGGDKADPASQQGSQQQAPPDAGGNQMCFSKMFKPCTVSYGTVTDAERRSGNKDVVKRMGDDCMSGISSCGHGFAPLICVVAGKDEHGVSQPASQPMCPGSITAETIGPATQQAQGCCIGAYPFEDCARNPLCKHAASPAFLEAKGKFSEALFARAIVDKQMANKNSGGDVAMKFDLSDDEKKALVGNLTDCPPLQAKGCSTFSVQDECESHYKPAATGVPGQFQPCVWNPFEFTCRAKTGMPPPTPTPVAAAEDQYAKPEGPAWYTSVYAAAPKAPTGAKPEFKQAPPVDGPPEFCLGPTLALTPAYAPQYHYRTAGTVPKRPDSPMSPTQVFQPIPGWGGN